MANQNPGQSLKWKSKRGTGGWDTGESSENEKKSVASFDFFGITREKERERERSRVIQPCRGITGRVISPSYGGVRKFLRCFYVVYARVRERLGHRIIRRGRGYGDEEEKKERGKLRRPPSLFTRTCGARSLKQIKESSSGSISSRAPCKCSAKHESLTGAQTPAGETGCCCCCRASSSAYSRCRERIKNVIYFSIFCCFLGSFCGTVRELEKYMVCSEPALPFAASMERICF